MIKVGSDFSGVGAFDQALRQLNIPYKTVFACDMDKYARKTYIHNYGEAEYYPENVYDRIIPNYPLDIYMTSPPCQSFSLAGKRKGEGDNRGVLFYNSHEFIKVNKPRYFIFENVKGLLSDDKGNTFSKWVQYLGGKSVNGNMTIFPHNDSVPYHVYWKVLNAKNFNIPQNRERVFIIGIRDDQDNNFTWPKEMFLERRLRDVLESDVDEKYYLSEKMVNYITTTNFIQDANKIQKSDVCDTILATDYKLPKSVKVGYINQDTQASQVYSPDGLGQTLCAGTHGYANGYVRVKDGVSINVIGNLPGNHEQNSRVYGDDGISPTLTTMQGGGQEPKIAVNDVVQLNPSKESGGKQPYQHNRIYADYGVMTTLDTECGRPSVYTNYRIRKLTPRECFRLMDFPDSFSWPVSDSQAYKQAGNSICVGVLSGILNKLNLDNEK